MEPRTHTDCPNPCAQAQHGVFGGADGGGDAGSSDRDRSDGGGGNESRRALFCTPFHACSAPVQVARRFGRLTGRLARVTGAGQQRRRHRHHPWLQYRRGADAARLCDALFAALDSAIYYARYSDLPGTVYAVCANLWHVANVF